ncbi:hypothetical protein FRX31_015502 [Thalictrum thalictroides]|uniref:Uncharacterized protein n=1 Tax=Thalictrum thalictroides TaxID=46969 RepID=A0A7J6WC63_THATH|nr:hypothetical protein FRX31_015502 [Thalictrum thalictroides]
MLKNVLLNPYLRCMSQRFHETSVIAFKESLRKKEQPKRPPVDKGKPPGHNSYKPSRAGTKDDKNGINATKQGRGNEDALESVVELHGS